MRKLFNGLFGWIDYQTFLHFSLIFVLVASLRHVAYAFSTLESNTRACGVLLFFVAQNCSVFWGYFQAIAIDLVIVALAYGIRTRSETGASVRWYWVGVVSFTLVSTYANLLYGLVFSGEVPASRDWPALSQVMVYAKPFLLSGVLPLMLIYISHITAYARVGEVIPARVALPFRERVQRAWAEALADEWAERNGSATPPAGWLQEQYQARIGEAVPPAIADAVAMRWARGVDGEARAESLLRRVEGAAALGPEHRQLIRHLKDEQGYTWPQVAEVVGRSETTCQRWYNLELSRNGTGG